MNKNSFAAKVLDFNKNLTLKTALPKGIRVMNPFRENDLALDISSKFYEKFYNDTGNRHIILGINPGRFGAGVTGVPFTDTKRMESDCGIEIEEFHTHEPSSVFVYEFINEFGGVEKFYRNFYINSVCPLGFVKVNEGGKMTNYNYYDSKDLQDRVTPFILEKLRQQIDFGIETDIAFCLGTGKNFKFLEAINQDHQYFDEIIPLEHPRYVMQYKSKNKSEYIDKFLTAFSKIDEKY